MAKQPKNIIVTRPEPDAGTLVAALESLGYHSISMPLFSIEYTVGDDLEMASVQAVLITSANGARALAQATVQRNIPLITVGPASCEIAQKLGFADCIMADSSYGGDAAGLVRYVTERCDASGGTLWHVSGSEVAGDVVGELTSKGFDVKRLELYRAMPAKQLHEAVITALEQHKVIAVTLYSARAAQQWIQLVEQHGLKSALVYAKAVCLSMQVAASLSEHDWQGIHIAHHPTQESLLSLMNEIA